MNKQKGLAPVLIILLIALAVGGYLLYQNSQLKNNNPTYDCGGFMGTQCPSGYECKMLGGDAGTCEKSWISGFKTLLRSKVSNK